MKATARSLFSATTAFGLTAFTLVSAFTATSASVAAASFGLLVVYGMIEMAILSYAPRRLTVRSTAPRLVATQSVPAPVMVEFPACSSRACAA